jgi:SAM-dependent methyltransferase
MSAAQLVPWWAKIAAKVVLSRLSIDYGRWQRFGLFKHGAMNDPAYAFRVVESHVKRSGLDGLQGLTVLELGPGDSVAAAVVARALGAEATYLVDSGDFAAAGMATYVAMQTYLEGVGLHPPDLRSCATRQDVLEVCGATYLTHGTESLKTIAAASVDLVFSQAVLEHVRLTDFAPSQLELRRVLRSTGLASHTVDLRDHLGGALNNLRISDALWEAEWMARSGFYTNRLRLSEVLDCLSRAGFTAEVTDTQRWDRLPTPKRKLQARFRHFPEEELCVSTFDIVGRPA